MNPIPSGPQRPLSSSAGGPAIGQFLRFLLLLLSADLHSVANPPVWGLSRVNRFDAPPSAFGRHVHSVEGMLAPEPLRRPEEGPLDVEFLTVATPDLQGPIRGPADPRSTPVFGPTITIDLSGKMHAVLTNYDAGFDDTISLVVSVRGTLKPMDGIWQGQQWIAAHAAYDLEYHVEGSARRRYWIFQETVVHEFNKTTTVSVAPNVRAPAQVTISMLDGVLDEVNLKLQSPFDPSAPYLYGIHFQRAMAQPQVSIRLPGPFVYPAQYELWDLSGKLRAEPVQGSVSAQVVGPAGQPVSEAAVDFGGRSFVTDADGRFFVPEVAPGPIRTQIHKDGYRPYDVTKRMPAFVSIDVVFVLEPEESPPPVLNLSVAIGNRGGRWIPGGRFQASVQVENISTQLVFGRARLSLALSLDSLADPLDIILDAQSIEVNLIPGASSTREFELTLPVPESPAQAQLGRRVVTATVSHWSGLPENLDGVKHGASDCFWYGEVQVVSTHGFNPSKSTGEDYESWTDFQQSSIDNINAMQATLAKDTALGGRMRRHITRWDSSTGFWHAFASIFLAKYMDAASMNSARDGDASTAAIQYSFYVMLRYYAILWSDQSRFLAAHSANRVFNEVRSELATVPRQARALTPIVMIGHSRGAALNARVSKYLAADGFVISDFISLDGYSRDWPDDAGLIGDISITGEAMSPRKWNLRVEEGLSEWVANIGDRDHPEAALMLEVIAVFVDALWGRKLGPWLPTAGVREGLRSFDIRAPARAPWGFFDKVVPGLSESGMPRRFSNHLSVQGDYQALFFQPLSSCNPLLWNLLGANRSSTACGNPATPSFPPLCPASPSVSGVLDLRSPSGSAGGDERIEPAAWDFDELAEIDNTLKSALPGPEVDELTRLVHQSVRDRGGPIHTAFDCRGAVYLVLDNAKSGWVRLSGSASIGQVVGCYSQMTSIQLRCRAGQNSAGIRLRVVLGDETVWNAPVEAHGSWINLDIPLPPVQGLKTVTFELIPGPDGLGALDLDDIKFVRERPRILIRRGQGRDTIVTVPCRTGIRVPVILERSEDLTGWVPFALSESESGSAEFHLSDDERSARFVRARIDL